MSRTVVSVSPERIAEIRGYAGMALREEHVSDWCLAAKSLANDALTLIDALDSFREQHSRIWTAAHDTGLSVPEPGWRDAEYREWDIRLEQTVECPDCGFSFGRGHTDETDGYSCPSCAEIRLREIETAARNLLDVEYGDREAGWQADLSVARGMLRAALESK